MQLSILGRKLQLQLSMRRLTVLQRRHLPLHLDSTLLWLFLRIGLFRNPLRNPQLSLLLKPMQQRLLPRLHHLLHMLVLLRLHRSKLQRLDRLLSKHALPKRRHLFHPAPRQLPMHMPHRLHGRQLPNPHTLMLHRLLPERRHVSSKRIKRYVFMRGWLLGHQLSNTGQLLPTIALHQRTRRVQPNHKRLLVHMLPRLHGPQLRDSDKRVPERAVSQRRHLH